MIDERTGLVHDYTKKSGVAETVMLLPEGAPEWASDPVQLWNRVEANEKRKDAQAAREINIALPVELNPEQRKALVVDFCREQFTDLGMVADVAFHDPDANNPHVHIMLTMRKFDGDGFGPKAREWNDKAALEQWRAGWKEHANRALFQAGQAARIDHRTLEAQAVAAVIEGDDAKAIRLSREAQRHHGGKQGAEIAQINTEVAEGMAEAIRRAAEWETAHAAEVAKQQEQARKDRRAAQQPTADKPPQPVERDKVKAAETFLKKREQEEGEAAEARFKALRLADAWGDAVVKRHGEARSAAETWTKAGQAQQAHQRRFVVRLGFGGRESKRLEEETERRRIEAVKQAEREKEAMARAAEARTRLAEANEAHKRAMGGVQRGQEMLAKAQQPAQKTKEAAQETQERPEAGSSPRSQPARSAPALRPPGR